jgi:hypothetical protein
MRFLEAAGLTFDRPKSSYQWYGRTITAWEVPDAVRSVFPVFRFDGDRELFERIINAPIEK